MMFASDAFLQGQRTLSFPQKQHCRGVKPTMLMPMLSSLGKGSPRGVRGDVGVWSAGGSSQQSLIQLCRHVSRCHHRRHRTV
jgi:hypothetical protein